MNWPFKFYSDEGYIIAVIENGCSESKDFKAKKESK
jgi:hypothetical protein